MTNVKPEGNVRIAPATVLNEGSLFRLGSTFAADGRVSWLPRSASGWQASNAYLLVQDGMYTLVDPGPRYHADSLIAQLCDLVPPDARLTVVLTRSERDSAGCLREVARALAIDRLYAMGTPNMFDGFEAAVAENLNACHGQELQRLPSGDVPVAPGRTLVGIAPLFRLLSTYWFYDTQTRSLFTSDAFGFLLGGTPEEAETPAERDVAWPDAATVREHVLAKFWWFENAHISAIIRSVEEIFTQNEVDRICPARGRVIEGAGAVRAALELYMDVLRQLRAESEVESGGE